MLAATIKNVDLKCIGAFYFVRMLQLLFLLPCSHCFKGAILTSTSFLENVFI